MQVYMKYCSSTEGCTSIVPFTRYIPFTKESEISYQIGRFKKNDIEISINGVVFATLPDTCDMDKFMGRFLELVHNALNAANSTFVAFDGQKLVDRFLEEIT